MSNLPEWVGIGVSFKCVFKYTTDLWHVRAIVDDMAVCCRWSKFKQRWQYEIYDEVFFEVYEPYIVVGKKTEETT